MRSVGKREGGRGGGGGWLCVLCDVSGLRQRAGHRMNGIWIGWLVDE